MDFLCCGLFILCSLNMAWPKLLAVISGFSRTCPRALQAEPVCWGEVRCTCGEVCKDFDTSEEMPVCCPYLTWLYIVHQRQPTDPPYEGAREGKGGGHTGQATGEGRDRRAEEEAVGPRSPRSGSRTGQGKQLLKVFQGSWWDYL